MPLGAGFLHRVLVCYTIQEQHDMLSRREFLSVCPNRIKNVCTKEPQDMEVEELNPHVADGKLPTSSGRMELDLQLHGVS